MVAPTTPQDEVEAMVEQEARQLFIAHSWKTARVGDWDDADESERAPFLEQAPKSLLTRLSAQLKAESGALEHWMQTARNLEERLADLSAQLKDALAVLERRRSIYEKKYADAVTDEWKRDLEGTLNYGRSDLFKHAAEAMEHAIEEVRAALKGSAGPVSGQAEQATAHPQETAADTSPRP